MAKHAFPRNLLCVQHIVLPFAMYILMDVSYFKYSLGAVKPVIIMSLMHKLMVTLCVYLLRMVKRPDFFEGAVCGTSFIS